MKEELKALIACFPKKRQAVVALLILLIGVSVFVYSQLKYGTTQNGNIQNGDHSKMTINNY